MNRLTEIREQANGSTAGMQEDVKWLLDTLEAAIKVLEEIANEDYRGNRSSGSQRAFHFLERLEK